MIISFLNLAVELPSAHILAVEDCLLVFQELLRRCHLRNGEPAAEGTQKTKKPKEIQKEIKSPKTPYKPDGLLIYTFCYRFLHFAS